jgi:hypothetical protein
MPFGRASGASVFDKFLNSLGAAIWLLVGMALLPGVWPAQWATHWRAPGGISIPLRPAMFVAVIVLYLLVFFFTRPYALLVRLAGRIHPKVGRLAEGVVAPFRELSWGRKLFFTAYGVVFQFRYLLVCYYLFHAFRISPAPDLAHVMLYASVAVFAAHLGGFAGMGPREAIIVTLFAAYASADALLGVGLMLSFSISIFPMLVGVPWTVWFLRRLKKVGEESKIAD